MTLHSIDSSDKHAVVVGFIDVCDSTRLFAERGNEVALTMISRCLNALQKTVTHHRGVIVQTLGDGLLCTFPDSDCAFQAAHALKQNEPQRQISIHAGFDYGSVITRHNSIFGDAVNVAARLAELANSQEFLFSARVVERLSGRFKAATHALGRVAIKGKHKPLQLYRLAPAGQHTTALFQTRPGHTDTNTLPRWLQLRYQGMTIAVGEQSVPFVIGRSENCDLVVNHDFASRRHASVEYRAGRFFLVDHSTNGTYVGYADRAAVALKRDYLQLQDNGYIALGCAGHDRQRYRIQYRLRAPALNAA